MDVLKDSDIRRPLSGGVHLVGLYWGGDVHGSESSRGSPNKVPFVAVAATNHDDHSIAVRMSKVKGFRKTEIAEWTIGHAAPDIG